jgi:hypothetical protein
MTSFDEVFGRRRRPQPEPSRAEGCIGVGQGGACRPLRRNTSAAINEAIRDAARVAQGRIGMDGVTIDDVLGR